MACTASALGDEAEGQEGARLTGEDCAVDEATPRLAPGVGAVPVAERGAELMNSSGMSSGLAYEGEPPRSRTNFS